MAAEEGQEALYEWNFDNTAELITLYEKFPCLYDVRSKDYKNRDTRDKVVTRNIQVSELSVPTGSNIPRNMF